MSLSRQSIRHTSVSAERARQLRRRRIVQRRQRQRQRRQCTREPQSRSRHATPAFLHRPWSGCRHFGVRLADKRMLQGDQEDAKARSIRAARIQHRREIQARGFRRELRGRVRIAAVVGQKYRRHHDGGPRTIPDNHKPDCADRMNAI